MSEDKGPNMMGMLKQLRGMQKDLEAAQKELEKATVTAEAGGGAVRVTVSGDQKVNELEIDAALLESGDAQKLSRLVQEALNKALEESRQMAKEKLSPLSSGLSF